MTENEALSELEKFQLQVEHSIAEEECCEYENPEEDLQKDKKFIDAFKIATKALKEIQQYRKIGTVEECRKAVEKQRAKEPKELDTEYGYFICGNCGGAIAYTDDFKSHKYCLNCGQAIQWDENLEGMRDE